MVKPVIGISAKASCLLVLLSVGCERKSIVVDFHLSSEISPLIITVDQNNGQSIDDTDGVVVVGFNDDGIALVESFDFLARWHKKRVFVDGVPKPDFKILKRELDLNKIKTLNEGGGVTYQSIENGSTRTFTLSYD